MNDKLELIIESALMRSSEPLSIQSLMNLFDTDKPTKVQIKSIIELLNNQYKDRSFEIVQVASGYRIQVRSGFDEWLRKLDKQTTSKYSRAFLETLVIIAYKQPIGRYDIEAIRGVDSTGVIKTLLSRNLIAIKGRGDGPGRPLLYSTTKFFLEKFGLNSLSDMPKLKEVSEIIESEPSLGEQITAFEDEGIKNKKNSDEEVPDEVK